MRSLVSGPPAVGPFVVLLLLLFRLFELEDTELRRLDTVAEEVRLLLVGETAESSSFCRVSNSMDNSIRYGSGRLFPSLTL